MQGTVLYGPGDIRFEPRPEPQILEPTDAIIRTSVTCVCGSDLWPYRGLQPVESPMPMGHEYCGVVEEVGSAVKKVRPGQFVIGSFAASDNTCPHCRSGYTSSCRRREWISTAQAPRLRVPLADGTLVLTPDLPADELLPSLLTLSDVMGTGWFAADAAGVQPGSTVVVVGDGAVGLLAVLSASLKGAGRIIAMSRHGARQNLAREFGALTWNCRWIRWLRPTGPWTNAARSRSCCGPDLKEAHPGTGTRAPGPDVPPAARATTRIRPWGKPHSSSCCRQLSRSRLICQLLANDRARSHATSSNAVRIPMLATLSRAMARSPAGVGP